VFIDQPIPQEPHELWRWDGKEQGWKRLDEPSLPWVAWTEWATIESATERRPPPNMDSSPGVYEIRRTDANHPDERLYIGYAAVLTQRLLFDLKYDTENIDDKGRTHKKARLFEAVGNRKDLLQLRWTQFQSKEEAHDYELLLGCCYLLRFGRLPDLMKRIG